jgi:pimeloyl-ACP methyl ester carboxylesterase
VVPAGRGDKWRGAPSRAQAVSASSGSRMSSIEGVVAYSTRGGESGWTVRVTSPLRSRSRRLTVSIRRLMPMIARSSWVNPCSTTGPVTRRNVPAQSPLRTWAHRPEQRIQDLLLGRRRRPGGAPPGHVPGDGRARRRVDSGDPAAFRANYEAFSREPGLHAELAACGVPLLLYAGTADPWHEPMRAFAERAGTGFFSVSGADHKGCWDRSADVLPQVLAFLAASP